MKITDCSLWDEIFTHVDPDTGQVRHFNATAMYVYATVAGHIEKLTLPLNDQIVEFVKRERGIEQPRVKRLKEPYLSRPIVAVHMADGSTLTVDGHHRIVRRWADGLTEVDAYCYQVGEWDDFLVTGLPT